MNYVFSDGEGTADNNSGSDYATPISGDMTAERWLEEAPLRVVTGSRSPSTWQNMGVHTVPLA